MAKLIVALLLSVGLANGLANFGGCTCEVDDFKERFDHSARPASLRLRSPRRLPRAQGASLRSDITVSAPGYARVFSSLPSPFKYALKCYDQIVLVPGGGDAVCPSTPAPAPGFGFTP